MKAFGWLIGAIVLVLVIVAVYVVVRSETLLEHAIERFGGRYLGVPVAVDALDLSLTQGVATVSGLVVGNPPGYDGQPALQVAEIHMVVDLGRTTSELIVLEQVTLHGAEVNALFRRQGSNLQQIMDHLNAQISAHERARQTRVVAEPRFVIEQLEIRDASAGVEARLLGRAAVNLPTVRVSGIGREPGGASVGQVLLAVLEPLFRPTTVLTD